MLQYKIPQNVGIEDKIVGPFSLRQLIILAVGGGISYVLFAITSKLYELNILEYILIALPALFALAAAMLKIHNVTFIKYLALLLEFAIKPKKRMWDHRGISALVGPDLTEKAAEKKTAAPSAEKGRKNVNLQNLSVTLDSGGFENVEQVKHEDIDEANDDDLITEAYFGHKQKESSTQNMYWRTRDMQKKKLELLAKMEQAQKGMQPATVPVTTGPQIPAKPPAPVAAPAAPPPQAPAQTPAPAAQEKKESVTQHLASVIKEARQNNRAKKEAQEKAATQPAPAPKEPAAAQAEAKPKAPPADIPPAPKAPEAPASEPAKAQQPTPNAAEPPKKKRKRKRKKKPGPGPVREGTQIDTTDKSKPAKPAPKPNDKHGETSFNDLSGGDEIEFNLD